jgi:hypothetical protein
MGFFDSAKSVVQRAADPYNLQGGVKTARGMWDDINQGPQIDSKDIDYDQGTKDLMGESERNANKSVDELTNESMKGSEAGQSLLGVGGDENLGGPSMDASMRALNKRQERQWADSSNKLRGKEESKSMQAKTQMMAQVAQQKAHQDAMRQQNWARKQQVDSFKKEARSKAIGSIVGGVGMVGGAVLGTLIAPGVGTAAGGQLGGSAGQMAGGAM